MLMLFCRTSISLSLCLCCALLLSSVSNRALLQGGRGRFPGGLTHPFNLWLPVCCCLSFRAPMCGVSQNTQQIPGQSTGELWGEGCSFILGSCGPAESQHIKAGAGWCSWKEGISPRKFAKLQQLTVHCKSIHDPWISSHLQLLNGWMLAIPQ